MPFNVFRVCAAFVSRTDPKEQCHILEHCNINSDLVTTHKVIKVYRMRTDCKLSASFWSPITLGKRVLDTHQTGGWIVPKTGKSLMTAKT
jgi:hypothetical protein